MNFSNPVRPAVSILKNDKFGMRTLGGVTRFHNGVDLRPQDLKIFASHEGVITFSGVDKYGGLYIDITNGNQMTRYLHNSANLFARGHQVSRGQLIGYIGATGRATGRHLHFETHINGKRVDPQSVVDFNSQPYTPPIVVTPPPTVIPTQPQQRLYTVVKGDSLWKIAEKQLGAGNRWTEIYNLNSDQITNPALIYPNQIFKLP